MAQYNIQLRGWQAVAGLVVLAGITGVQIYSRMRSVDDAMRDAVRTELLQEYSGRGPKDIARFVAEARAGQPVESVPALVQRDVELTSMAARGTTGGAIVVRTEVTAGAGGTVANNLVALGAGRVAVLGVVGDDGFGYELSAALARRGIASDLLIRTPQIQTFTYIKLINSVTNIEDTPRVDFVTTVPLDPPVERQVLDMLPGAVDQFDVILISDQAETTAGGVVTPAVRELLAELAPNYPDKVFLVDSRARIERFRQMIIKPNR